MTTTRKPSLRWKLDCITATDHQANRYRQMAEAIRRLDPTHTDGVVNEEAARYIALAREMEESADADRDELAEWYTWEQIEAAL